MELTDARGEEQENNAQPKVLLLKSPRKKGRPCKSKRRVRPKTPLKRVLVSVPQQPHRTNESTLLELSRIGIFIDNPNSEGSHPSESTINHFSNGNKKQIQALWNEKKICEKIRREIGMKKTYYVESNGISGGRK